VQDAKTHELQFYTSEDIERAAVCLENPWTESNQSACTKLPRCDWCHRDDRCVGTRQRRVHRSQSRADWRATRRAAL